MLSKRFTNFFIRQGHPDFLDLPWEKPLSTWREECPRFIDIEKGISRHIVVFVSYREAIYAIKELPKEIGEREYRTLREIEKQNLPCVIPVGFGEFYEEDRSILITKYLDFSLPYRSLFQQAGLIRYQDRLLDTIAMLLVQIHLKGIFWGDCSLSNTLFRRDIGELQAFLVDAETSKVYPSLSDGKREQDLMIMEENIAGDLMDLAKEIQLPEPLEVYNVSVKVRGRYEHLWEVLTHDETFEANEQYRIQERIKKINNLGFTVDEIQLIRTDKGNKIILRPFVSERDYHSRQLHSMTGIAAREKQARLILNEINEMKARISQIEEREVPIYNIAFRWIHERYKPTIDRLGLMYNAIESPEMYCEVLEHKWFLSEKKGSDVGLSEALEDFMINIYDKKTKNM